MTEVAKLQYIDIKIHFSRSTYFMFLIVKMFVLWDFASKYLNMSTYSMKFQLTSQKVE